MRAANDNFEDGTPDEYYVKDATLILFTGAEGETEKDARFHSAYTLNAADWNDNGVTTDNITTTAKIVQKINQVSSAKIYALVVLNHNGVFTVKQDNTLEVGEGLSPFTPGVSTLSDLNILVSQTVSETVWKGQSFLMSNSPLYTKAGGSQKPETEGELKVLSLIDASQIRDTEEEAREAVAANIYVERAQAKVTLSGEDGSLTGGPVEEGDKHLSYQFAGWVLDNTNTKSFLVRDYSTEWNSLGTNKANGVSNLYRFVGSAAVSNDLYRTYWGKDVNYAEDASGLKAVADKNGNINTSETLLPADGETPAYCFENTADVERMTEKNNTRAVIKVILNEGKDFYVVNGNKDVVYLGGENINGNNGINTRIKEAFMDYPGIKNWFNANLKDDQTLDPATDLVVTFNDPKGEQGGMIQNITVDVSEEGGQKLKEGKSLTDEQKKCLQDANFSVDLYEGGVSYYTVHIAHFGDDLTPWNDGETPSPSVTGTSAAGIYPKENQDANYLGRWGVLRNNWYDLKVTSIQNIGSSTVPPVTGEEIDKMEKYISVEINILAWAKRQQDVQL